MTATSTRSSTTKKSTKNARVPRLRFPEFEKRPDWESKKLGQLLSVGNGRDYKHLGSGDIPVYGSGGYMLSVDAYLHEGESVCIGRKGTINAPMFLDGKFWTVDTLFYTHSFQNFLPKFAFLTFQNINWLNYSEASGVPSLQKANIVKISVPVPSLPEQQKIADCLSSLDDLITAESEKLETLKVHKKGLMQELFPREGESVPRLRFPEFEGSGEWEVKRLGEVCRFQDGFAFQSKDFTDDLENTTQVIRITDINNKNLNRNKVFIPTSFIKKLTLDKYKVARGDLLLSLTGAAGFNFFIWNGPDALINQRTAKVIPINAEEGSLTYLIAPLIHERINIKGEGQNNNLSKTFLNELTVLIPCPREQQKIASVLSSLDDRITAQSERIELLKNHKKGLMQQLFPVMEG